MLHDKETNKKIDYRNLSKIKYLTKFSLTIAVYVLHSSISIEGVDSKWRPIKYTIYTDSEKDFDKLASWGSRKMNDPSNLNIKKRNTSRRSKRNST